MSKALSTGRSAPNVDSGPTWIPDSGRSRGIAAGSHKTADNRERCNYDKVNTNRPKGRKEGRTKGRGGNGMNEGTKE